jgi:dethiobiotin synthetase
MDGVFVTGTDTGVGKTVIASGLLKLLYGSKSVHYWKPVQTGTIVGDDTQAAKSLTGMPADRFWSPVYRFPEPLSPHMAAQKWGKKVEVDTIVDFYREHKKNSDFVVVEGAGGLMVPLNEKALLIDLIGKLSLPLLIVSEDRVGSINQTLLTVNAARAANIPILGVILTKARKTLGNAEAISLFGKVEVLAEFDPSEDSRTIIGQVASNDRLRALFNISVLPK